MITILHGDCRVTLRDLPAASVQMIATSPPYWNLRDYGVAGQIGLEATPEEYVENLVQVFREVRRVLRPDGVVFLNLADTYASKPYEPWGVKPKDEIGIPDEVVRALRRDGWYRRATIIWAKGRDGDIEDVGPGNVMPESAQDRPVKSHEYIFLLSKAARYYWDGEAIKEPASYGENRATFRGGGSYIHDNAFNNSKHLPSDGIGKNRPEVSSRNARSVWLINTSGYSGAHFATFPERLVERMILAGSSPTACGTCGAPYQRQVKRTPQYENVRQDRAQPGGAMAQIDSSPWRPPIMEVGDLRPTCPHDDPTGRSVVLDPFSGSGTTLRVAEKHGRDSIGCELNAEYITLAEDRTDGIQVSMESLLV